MVYLKVCGITRLQDALKAVDLGISFLGFNFYPESKRYLPPEQAGEIIRKLPPFVCKVGILVKPTIRQCLETIRLSGVDMLQIYDPADFDHYASIPVPVIDAYRFGPNKPLNYRTRGERYILVDIFDEGEYGGSGNSWDYQTLPSQFPRDRLFLAGGINEQNILRAIEQVRPFAVDVASGSESAPGIKDARRIRDLQSKVLAWNLRELKKLKEE